MNRRPRRNHTSPCEARVALAAIKGDRTLAQLAEQFDVHPNQITSWKAQLEEGAADVFGPGGGTGTAQPAVDVIEIGTKPVAQSGIGDTIPVRACRRPNEPSWMNIVAPRHLGNARSARQALLNDP